MEQRVLDELGDFRPPQPAGSASAIEPIFTQLSPGGRISQRREARNDLGRQRVGEPKGDGLNRAGLVEVRQVAPGVPTAEAERGNRTRKGRVELGEVGGDGTDVGTAGMTLGIIGLARRTHA
jgi:hypothetical protein